MTENGDANFVECRSVLEANRVDMRKYTFLGMKNDGAYCFKKRAGAE